MGVKADAVLLRSDPCSAPLLTLRSLEVLQLTIPIHFSFLTGPPAMYPRRNLPESAMADPRRPYLSIARRNQQSNCQPLNDDERRLLRITARMPLASVDNLASVLGLDEEKVRRMLAALRRGGWGTLGGAGHERAQAAPLVPDPPGR